MSRVITFSRTFPSYHPKAGQPTRFVERLYESFMNLGFVDDNNDPPLSLFAPDWPTSDPANHHWPKHHTVRNGRRWKAGDKFSPRVWTGQPYNSKQAIIAPDIEVKKTWDVEIDACGVIAVGSPNETCFYTKEGIDEKIAKNDGLEYDDFLEWLVMPIYRSKNPKTFYGQIICWNQDLEY